jgi:hypothetical protein
MRQEPRLLEFAVEGKRDASARAFRHRWATSLVTVAVFLVHAVSPPFAALADSNAGSPSGQTRPEAASPSAPAAKPKERAFHGALPQSVADMREMILAAIVAGDVSELSDAIEWNEIAPDFGNEAGADPIAHWKKISRDGEGREVLAIAADLLALAPARLAIGKDPENTLVYVWPYLAELPLDQLKPSEEVDLYRLVPVETAKAMRAAKKWTWWRIAIGADGTWHTFRKYD